MRFQWRFTEYRLTDCRGYGVEALRAARGASRGLAAVLTAVALAGCVARPAAVPPLDFDPLEASNREAHAVNKSFDSAAYGPVSRAYGEVVPEPARNVLQNFTNHVSLPAVALQYALQGRPVRVLESSMRFAVNTTFGLGGLLDPAAEMDLPFAETNADETLYRWGVPEGGYLELPIGGPGTQRDWTGYVLDLATDPLTYLTTGVTTVAVVGLRGVELLEDRNQLDPVVQALYYESTDSYTAQRISYLQNMRARLQGGTELEVLEDPYADF